MFANTQLAGIDMGFPDVCLTPTPAGPVPIPYPNIAAGPMGVPAVYNVLFMCAPAHNMGTIVPLTNASMAELRSSELAQGTGLFNLTRQLGGSLGIAVMATLLTRFSLQNSTNCPGARVVLSQTRF
jgi:hypothetical protein